MRLKFYFQRLEYLGQAFDDMQTSFGEFESQEAAALHALGLSKELNLIIIMHAAGKKEYHYYSPPVATVGICLNCRHWRDKAWTDKGWGICDNPKNEVNVRTGMISAYVSDLKMRQELAIFVGNSIRYPEDFGCIFFEPSNVAGS